MEPGQGAANAGSKEAASFVQFSLMMAVKKLSIDALEVPLLPDLKAPLFYTCTGELYGIESLYRQAGMVLNTIETDPNQYVPSEEEETLRG